jgi:probable phosphoglycerate mutase
MSAGTVILLRHGQTDYNATGRLQGQVDIDLNETGRAQAQAAAEVLARVQPAAIVSSDLSRAAETAQILGALAGVAVGIDPRLRERSFGDWEGLTHTELAEQWPEQFRSWSAGAHPEGIGAETRHDVGERVARAVTEHAGHHEEGGVIVVVAHGAAISAGLTTLIGQDPESWRGITGIGNCHWSVLRTNNGWEPAWRLSAHNVGVQGSDFPRAGRIV